VCCEPLVVLDRWQCLEVFNSVSETNGGKWLLEVLAGRGLFVWWGEGVLGWGFVGGGVCCLEVVLLWLLGA